MTDEIKAAVREVLREELPWLVTQIMAAPANTIKAAATFEPEAEDRAEALHARAKHWIDAMNKPGPQGVYFSKSQLHKGIAKNLGRGGAAVIGLILRRLCEEGYVERAPDMDGLVSKKTGRPAELYLIKFEP
jgi:hypothetical protein